jgi:hypothetical protein
MGTGWRRKGPGRFVVIDRVKSSGCQSAFDLGHCSFVSYCDKAANRARVHYRIYATYGEKGQGPENVVSQRDPRR